MAFLGNQFTVFVKCKSAQCEVLDAIHCLGHQHAIGECVVIDQGMGMTSEDGIKLGELRSGFHILFKTAVREEEHSVAIFELVDVLLQHIGERYEM